MHANIKIVQIFSALIALTLPCTQFGQDLHKTTIDFSGLRLSKIDGIGPVRLGYPTCQTNGTMLFITMIDPAHSPESRLAALTTTGTLRYFNLNSLKGLKGVGLLSVTTDASGTTLLISGLPDLSSPEGVKYSDQTRFLLHYSLDGSLSRIIPLPSNSVAKIASLPSGGFAALSVNPDDGSSSLGFLDASGNILKSFDVSNQLLSLEETKEMIQEHPLPGLSDFPTSQQTVIASSRIQITGIGNQAVVLVPTKHPRLLIQDINGTSRVVSLTMPDGLIASTFYWERSLGFAILATDIVSGKASVLRLDADTGKTTGEIQIIGKGISSISAVCSRGQDFYALSIDGGEATLVKGLISNH